MGDSMDSFEFWLRRMESKVERMSYRPSTREEASDLFDLTKDLKDECETRDLPKELLDEEEEARAIDLLSRYNRLLNALSDNCIKAEHLCSCWDKLDEDTKNLTSALKSSGGTRKLSMEELEDSLAQIKAML